MQVQDQCEGSCEADLWSRFVTIFGSASSHITKVAAALVLAAILGAPVHTTPLVQDPHQKRLQCNFLHISLHTLQ